ncbi:MAG: hypothetical protein ACYS74_01645 [Planctomycetota bacterium]|jgi:hypothetical protein
MIGTSTTINQIPGGVYDSVSTEPLPAREKGLDIPTDDPSGQYAAGARYFVGADQASTFRERIQEVYADNCQITDAVAELDEYFSDRDFEDRPEVRHFIGWVARSIEDPRMAGEIAAEIINQGYITALKRLGYKDAVLNVAFSRAFAKEHEICFVAAFMFGPGGAARIALADWLIEEKLHGMYRPGKAPGSSFSEQAKKIWCQAESKNQYWPQTRMEDGELIPVDVSAGQGKLPAGVEQVLRDSWRRSLYQGKDYTYKGMRRLCGDQNFQMIEDMVGALLDAESWPKLYRCPLDRAQLRRYNQIVEHANSQGMDPFYAMYVKLFDNPDTLKPLWDKARRMLYEYSVVRREAAIQAGLVEEPATTGITWRPSHRAWQAQIAVKGKQKYLGIFKNKADARAAYYRAATEVGHIPGMPDIDKIWPTWEQQKDRLAQVQESPRMPILYQQQDTHKERQFGLRPPEALRALVQRMKSVDWLVKYCMLAFDDNWPTASQDVAIKSRGRYWCDEIRKRGRRFVIQGCTSIDKQTGRIGITIYRPGFDNERVLAEEIYHIVFGIIQRAQSTTYQATQRWHQSRLKKGMDPTVCLDEAFSKSMALEESGIATGLPRSLVKHAQRIFSPAHRIPETVIAEVKASWS